MKPSVRALIFSLLIFPGAGLWAIGEKRQSLFFIVPGIIALIFFIARLMSITQAIMDKAVKSMNIDIVAIYVEVHVQLMKDPYLHKTLYFLIALFIVSGIYSYWMGKKKEPETN